MVNKNKFALFSALSNGTLISEGVEAPNEPYDVLSEDTIDISRVIHSIIEELAAFNDYNLRMDATKDKKIRKVLEHNRDEEMDHAMMLLEVLRMRMPVIDQRIKKYIFKEDKEQD